jgi:hypothetical protein
MSQYLVGMAGFLSNEGFRDSGEEGFRGQGFEGSSEKPKTATVLIMQKKSFSSRIHCLV